VELLRNLVSASFVCYYLLFAHICDGGVFSVGSVLRVLLNGLSIPESKLACFLKNLLKLYCQ
jgi:hypothetical protein